MQEARHFTILTDHKPLTFAFNQKREKCLPRQFNHIGIVSQYSTDIRHTSGEDNVVADALSRVEVITSPVTHEGFAADQENDDELRTLLVSTTAIQLERILILGTSLELYCDISSGKSRPHVPTPLRRPIFNSLYSLSKPGINATANLVCQSFV